MMKKFLSLFLLSGLVALCAWSPWLTRERASTLAETQFNKAWSTVIDGCGTSGDEFGVKDFEKIPFGARVTLEYQCGLIMPGEPALRTNVFVSFFGLARGYPKP